MPGTHWILARMRSHVYMVEVRCSRHSWNAVKSEYANPEMNTHNVTTKTINRVLDQYNFTNRHGLGQMMKAEHYPS